MLYWCFFRLQCQICTGEPFRSMNLVQFSVEIVLRNFLHFSRKRSSLQEKTGFQTIYSIQMQLDSNKTSQMKCGGFKSYLENARPEVGGDARNFVFTQARSFSASPQ